MLTQSFDFPYSKLTRTPGKHFASHCCRKEDILTTTLRDFTRAAYGCCAWRLLAKKFWRAVVGRNVKKEAVIEYR